MPEQTFTGSCLCGQVKYQLVGEPKRFYHCHCLRCRKASGTGHASNIMVEGDKLTWLSGFDLLRRFNVPEAERFYTFFCSLCGSPMPRAVPELAVTVIPAGSLDHEPKIQPGSRIFWDSRSAWSCDATEIKHFSEYPR